MSRGLNWNRPRGSGRGGSTISRAPSGAEVAKLLGDYRAPMKSKRGRAVFYGLKKLRESAANGDRAAQIKLAGGVAKSQMAQEPLRRKRAAEADERRARSVPRGLKRIKRFDRETGEAMVADLPIPGRHFDKVMQQAGDLIPRCDLAPDMSPAQWHFLIFSKRLPREE